MATVTPSNPQPQAPSSSTAPSSPLEEELRQSCFQYYLAQQALQNAEDDNIQMENVIKTLKGQIDSRAKDVSKLKEVKRDLESQVDRARYLPKGTDPETAKRYIEAERILHTRIALADSSFEQLKLDSEKMKGEIDREAKTISVLEESLASQVRYNKVLTDTMKESIEKAKHEERRLANLKTRRAALEAAIQQETTKERKLKGALATAVEMKHRAQNDIRSRDSEAVRLRADVAFGRRLHLGELEHAREQELWLEELLLENKKLKVLMQNARKNTVDLGKRKNNNFVSGDEELGSDIANLSDQVSPVKKQDESLAMTSPSGKTHAVKATTAGDPMLGDPQQKKNKNNNDNDDDDADNQRPKRLVDEFRAYNLQLLQQMVNSLNILQTQIVNPTAPNAQSQ